MEVQSSSFENIMMGNNSSRSGSPAPTSTTEQAEDQNRNLAEVGDNLQSTSTLEMEEPLLGATAISIDRMSEIEELEREYEILSLADVVALMDRTISEISQLTNLKKTLVRILLNHVKWEKDTFFDKFYGDDLAGFFASAGAVMPDEFLRSPPASPSTSEIDVVGVDSVDDENKWHQSQVSPSQAKKMKLELPAECSICLSYIENLDSLIENGCKDAFCIDCWRDYLAGKIMHEGMASFIQCPGFGCKILVEDDLVLKLTLDPLIRERYERRITEDFVGCNRLMKCCPAPGCTKVIKTSLKSHGHVECGCGFAFCFCCGGEVHDPVNCEILKIWMRKVERDSATGSWIANNTKECPKCNSMIEKMGGCNHMTCRVQSCRYEFCWVCLGPWAPHGNTWFKCNIFESNDAKAARDNLSVKRFEMERFVFYSSRFKNHLESLKFESKLETSVNERLKVLSNKVIHMDTAVPTVTGAVKILTRCRRTLAYTYAFAFALRKTNQCHIFEDNQRDLEVATENLSELLERRLNDDALENAEKFKDVHLKILNQSQYCEGRRNILMNHVKEGEILGIWEFLPVVDQFFAPLDSATPDPLSRRL